MSGEPYYSDDLVTLWHGDALTSIAWLSADVLITDPPYGIGYSTNWNSHRFGNGAVAGDQDTAIRDRALEMWGDKAAAVFSSWRCSPYGSPHPMPLIFDKGDVVGMGDLDWPWRPSYERCWIYGTTWTRPRSAAVIRFRVLPGNFTERHHPTEKPVPVMAQLISKHGGIVADPFVGSGSTLLAAKQLGRRSVGVEIEERYCEIAARRLSQGVLDFGGAA